jgi:hypothetical protein
MPYQYSLDSGEELLRNFSFKPSRNSEALVLVVTTQAVFLPRKKLFAVKDPTYLERVSLSQITQVRLKRVKQLTAWVLALPMIFAGSALTAVMLWPYLHGTKGGLSGYPPALLVCGFVIPFVAKDRYQLQIHLTNGVFRWQAPILVDKTSRATTLEFFGTVVDAFRTAGINIVDERESNQHLQDGAQPELASYPRASLPSEPGSGVIRACRVCSEPIKVSRWDDLNGFLIRCPHCSGVHGRSWRVYYYALASLLLNALSFFVTMRWKRALPLALAFGLGFLVADQIEKHLAVSQGVLLIVYGLLLLGPLIVNTVLILRHEMALGASTGRVDLHQR